MSGKRKNAWDNYKDRVAKKRIGANGGKAGPSGLQSGSLTVQRLSASVQGKAQKYTRIGPLTLVPLDQEPTLDNIKNACKLHFNTNSECDILAGERGPSFTDESQITNWKVIHVRFLDGPDYQQEPRFISHKSEPVPKSPEKPSVQIHKSFKSSCVPRSVSLSQMLQVGKLIEPETNVMTIHLEEFSICTMKWLNSFPVTISLQRNPFGQGAFREAYMAKALSGLPKADYVLKKYKKDEIPGIEHLFGSIESHTRKSVQLNALARNFAQQMDLEAPKLEFGRSFCYNKVYFSRIGNECVTLESFVEGRFQKFINNTGDICTDKDTELGLKTQAFVHYTYNRSDNQLIVLDIQGVGYTLCDPEIATTHKDDEDNFYFCTGNLSTQAINKFFSSHSCNKYCKMLNL